MLSGLIFSDAAQGFRLYTEIGSYNLQFYSFFQIGKFSCENLITRFGIQ